MPTTAPRSEAVFGDRDAEAVREALHRTWGQALGALDESMHEALRGSAAATARYVRDYQRLADELLDEALASRSTSHEGGEDSSLSALGATLASGAAEAPFTVWVARYDADGVALDLVNRIRPWIGAASLAVPTAPPGSLGDLDEGAVMRFLRRVRACLDRVDVEPLHRLMQAWDFSVTELAGLFGVRRQAVGQWLQKGSVPAERQEKLATLLALTDLLERKLKPGRLPGVARRPAAAYGGESMLDLIRDGREHQLLEIVRESFDWSTAA